MAILTPLQATLLKTHPVDSNLAPDKLPAGFKKFNVPLLNKDGSKKTLAAVKVVRDVLNYARVEFNPPLTIGPDKYPFLYIFCPHWEGVTALINAQVLTASPLSPAGSSIMQRPGVHYVQNNNHDWADDGSQSTLRYGAVQCGLTSLAITLSEPGMLTDAEIAKIIAKSPTGKFDDGVAAIFKEIGAQSIAMEGHVAVLNHLGFKAEASRDATVAEAKEHLEKKSRIVAGTIYKASGHFVSFTGFDIKKNLVQVTDPYGIRDKVSTNQWETIFQKESDAQIDWYDAQTMNDLWASQKDGWCVLVTPKSAPIVLSPPPAAAATPAATPVSATPVTPEGTITIIQGTYLKKAITAAKDQPESDKKFYVAGTVIECEVIGAKANHGQVKLPDGSVWFVFNAHFKGQEHVTKSVAAPTMAVPRAKIEAAIKAVANSCLEGAEIKQIVDSIMSECPKFGVTTPMRLAHFIGQTALESGGYMYTHEIGDDAYFTENYEGREDLGNIYPGDGAKYPGMGILQVTGRGNVTKFAKKIGRLDLIDDPTPMGEYPLCMTSALSWWDDNRMNPDCDNGISESNIEVITRVINGGTNHLHNRIDNTLKIAPILGC
jgi:predicted chitinase